MSRIQIELVGSKEAFGEREWMNLPADADVSEQVKVYLSVVRQDESRGERHAYRRAGKDAYEIRSEKVMVDAKYRKGRRNE